MVSKGSKLRPKVKKKTETIECGCFHCGNPKHTYETCLRYMVIQIGERNQDFETERI